MKIKIRNRTTLPNKAFVDVKNRLARVKDKFKHLLYAEVYLSEEGSSVKQYKAVVRLGVPGYDIIITNNAEKLNFLWRQSFQDIKRYLQKHKEKTTGNNLWFSSSD